MRYLLTFDFKELCWTLFLDGVPTKAFPTGTATLWQEKNTIWISLTRGLVGRWIEVSGEKENYCMGDMEQPASKEDKVWASVGFQQGSGIATVRVNAGMSEIRHLNLTPQDQMERILSECADACDRFLRNRYRSD